MRGESLFNCFYSKCDLTLSEGIQTNKPLWKLTPIQCRPRIILLPYLICFVSISTRRSFCCERVNDYKQ